MASTHGRIKFATRDLITMRLGEQQLHEALLRSEAEDHAPKPRQMNALGTKRRTS
jgi:hypothetical protein